MYPAMRTDLLDLCVKSVEINEQVDAGICQNFHAAVVIGMGINMVDADGVGPQFGHELNVASALFRVDEWIIGNELIRDACNKSILSVELPERLRGDELAPFKKYWVPSS